jgi:hypothetical protein
MSFHKHLSFRRELSHLNPTFFHNPSFLKVKRSHWKCIFFNETKTLHA